MATIKYIFPFLVISLLAVSCKEAVQTPTDVATDSKRVVKAITNERIKLTDGSEIMIPDHRDVAIIIRHAEKLKEDNNNPKLSPVGQARAARLTEMVKDANINMVFSTPYFRTLHTVSDIAAAERLKVTPYQPAGISKIVEEIKSNGRADRVIICGHSNTVHPTVNQLVKKAVYLNPLDDSDYDHLYVVVMEKDPIIHALHF